jgi:hypothetical protein
MTSFLLGGTAHAQDEGRQKVSMNNPPSDRQGLKASRGREGRISSGCLEVKYDLFFIRLVLRMRRMKVGGRC